MSAYRWKTFHENEDRPEKPRRYGVTEMRGPDHSLLSQNFLQDIFESMGDIVDGLRFAGGSHSLMPKSFVKEVIDEAHKHDVYVSTGNWAENLLRKGPSAFKEYVEECKSLGFDTIELNVGSLGVPEETLLRLVRLIKSGGLRVKPLFAVKVNKSDIPVGDRAFGAYVVPRPRSSEFVEDVDLLIRRAERCLEAGADMIMIEADDVCKKADSMRADIIAKVIGRLGVEKTMFEASNPRTSEWFIQHYGPRVNLFVDHSHVMGLECLRGRNLEHESKTAATFITLASVSGLPSPSQNWKSFHNRLDNIDNLGDLVNQWYQVTTANSYPSVPRVPPEFVADAIEYLHDDLNDTGPSDDDIVIELQDSEDPCRPQLTELYGDEKKAVELECQCALKIKRAKFSWSEEENRQQAAWRPNESVFCGANGNELQRYYGTTVTCSLSCCSSSSSSTSNIELCELDQCGLCPVLKEGLGQEVTSSTAGKAKLKNKDVMLTRGQKKAVVVCRVIAGKVKPRLRSQRKVAPADQFEQFDSAAQEDDDLSVKDSRAILPCFVLIY
ncbi:hypothetical protein ACLB2K_024300 [Fragaria x ananassa]